MKKNIYLVLMILGIILPYTQFVPWSNVHGFNLSLMINQMFANQIAAGIAIDALLAAVVIVFLILFENDRVKVKHLWLPILGIFISGISLALPLYLYMRERALEIKSRV